MECPDGEYNPVEGWPAGYSSNARKYRGAFYIFWVAADRPFIIDIQHIFGCCSTVFAITETPSFYSFAKFAEICFTVHTK